MPSSSRLGRRCSTCWTLNHPEMPDSWAARGRRDEIRKQDGTTKCVTLRGVAMPSRIPMAKPARAPMPAPRPTYDADRPSAAKRGYDRHWQRFRLLILARDPLCRRCDSHVSELVHHLVPLDKGGARLSSVNCVAVCTPCHERITAEEKQGRRWMPGEKVS